ncbi:MAG: TonB family protein [Pseudomonadota bacterium]
MSYVSAQTNKVPDARGMGVAIGIHGLVIAVVLSLPGIEIPNPIPNIVSTYNVPSDPEPAKPVVEPDKPVMDIPVADPKPADVMPLVKHPLPADPVRPLYKDLDAEITAGSGLSDRLPVDVTPILPEPVIAQAKLNSRYSAGFQPPYPSGLLRLETEGLVSVRVLVGTNGRVKQIELVDTPHPDFWTATRRHALKNWRFTPATRDGVPFESWIDLKVRFEITG